MNGTNGKRIIDFTVTPLTEFYGMNSFNDSLMKERLPKTIYKELKKVQAGEKELTREVAEVVANAMKDWAIERGATHFTHWFQPLTGLTAEKHDSFILRPRKERCSWSSPARSSSRVNRTPPPSPRAGLRSTFEARGYTAWDTTSPAFLKEDNTGVTLYIPTAFVSYTGVALDKKVPLLRSMEALNRQAVRVLKLLGNTTSKRVRTTVGPEQEYFLVDKEFHRRRPTRSLDRRPYAVRLLPAKGQEMEDHYFGAIKERVADFMRELNCELWKLGIAGEDPAQRGGSEPVRNRHRSSRPSNVAADSNQLVMETMKRVADPPRPRRRCCTRSRSRA